MELNHTIVVQRIATAACISLMLMMLGMIVTI